MMAAVKGWQQQWLGRLLQHGCDLLDLHMRKIGSRTELSPLTVDEEK
jgi:hypothetical protein